MTKNFLLAAITFFLIIFHSAKAQQASLQLVHNSADPALMLIDVYVNDSLVVDDMILRSATGFIDLPADSLLHIGIALNTSSSSADTLASFDLTMNDSVKYIAIVNGVLDTTQFLTNPDGISTALNIIVIDSVATAASNPAHVDYKIIQGSTDLGICDLVIRDEKIIADNLVYTDVSAYDSVTATSFTLDIMPVNDDSIISSYQVDFTGMDGSTAVLIASGFRDPAANQNGMPFEFFAVFANGSVLEYFPVSIAKFQAIHNCADPLLDSIDIYTNGVLVVDNFHFRTATTLFNVPGDVPISVAIAPGNSVSINDTLKSYSLLFSNGKNYTGIATGVIDTSAFASNPEGLNTSFTMLLSDGMRWKALDTTNLDVRFINGVTDAPTVDYKLSGGQVLTDNIPFGSISNYISMDYTITYNIDVTDSSNTISYNSYQLDPSNFGGKSAVMFFSGFLNPSANQNGPLYGLFAAFADGSVIQLPVVTGSMESSTSDLLIYPNPANELINIRMNTRQNTECIINIYGLDGKGILCTSLSGNSSAINVSGIAKGIYILELTTKDHQYRTKLVLQ